MTKRFNNYFYILALTLLPMANAFAMESAAPDDQDTVPAAERGNNFDLELFILLKQLALKNYLPEDTINEIIKRVLALLIEDARLSGDYVLERVINDKFESTVVFSPDGRWLASNGKIVRVEDGIVIHRFEGCGTYPGNVHLFSPNGKLFASSGTHSHHLFIWNIEDKKLLWDFEGGSSVSSCAFSTDSALVAFGGQGYFTVGDLKTRSLKKIHIASNSVSSLAFSPDRSLIALGTRKDIQLWHIASQLKKRVIDRNYQGSKLVFSSDGEHLTALRYNAVQTWDIENGIEQYALEINSDIREGGTLIFAVSLECKLIATGWRPYSSRDPSKSSLEIWSQDSGQRIRDFGASCWGIESIAFSPHGDRMATTSIFFGGLQIWIIRPLAKAESALN